MEFCNLSAEQIHQLTVEQATEYCGYIIVLNETNSMILDLFKSIDTVNLLDASEKSSSCDFFNWEDSKNTLFGKPANPLDNCFSLLKQACSSLKKGDEMMESINNQLYSQAFRKACAYGAVEVINILLQHRSLLNNFEINEPSSNGKTALDWVMKATIDKTAKESLVNKFISLGAVSGEQIKLESTKTRDNTFSL